MARASRNTTRTWLVGSVVSVLIIAGCGEGTASVLSHELDGAVLVLDLDTCNADLRLESIQESDQAVTVVVEQRNDNTGDDCSDALRVELGSPLGDRLVVDGSSGVPVPRQ